MTWGDLLRSPCPGSGRLCPSLSSTCGEFCPMLHVAEGLQWLFLWWRDTGSDLWEGGWGGGVSGMCCVVGMVVGVTEHFGAGSGESQGQALGKWLYSVRDCVS